jgi:hypothetical protein
MPMKVATSPTASMAQPGLQASASKLKLDSLFLQWFSMPETQRLVRQKWSAAAAKKAWACRLRNGVLVLYRFWSFWMT